MKVCVKSLKLENFRNFDKIEIAFDGCTAICGKNHIGKSNIVDAISYLFTGYLLRDCTNLQSMKKDYSSRNKVIISAILEKENEDEAKSEKEFTKVFYENWARIRGSEEEELKGHQTDFFVDGSKLKTLKDFETELYNFFEIDQNAIGGDLNILRALIDSKYLSEEIADSAGWKKLRNLIVNIAGDVSNEDVAKTNDSFDGIISTIIESGGDIDYSVKKAKSDALESKKSIEKSEYLIAELKQNDEGISTDEVAKLKEEKEMLKSEIENGYKSGLSFNEEVKRLQNEIEEKSKELSEKHLIEVRAHASSQQSDIEKIKIANEEKTKISSDLQVLKNRLSNAITIQGQLTSAINRLKEENEVLQKKLNGKRIEYKDVSSKCVERIECPNCHHIINQESIEKVEERKKQNLDGIVKFGEKLKEEIKSNKEEIDSKKEKIKSLIELRNELEQNISDLEIEERKKGDEIKRLNDERKEFVKSENLEKLEKEIESLKMQFDREKIKIKNEEESIKQKFNESNARLKEIDKKLDQVAYYASIDEKVNQEFEKLKSLRKELVKKEELVLLLNEFYKTKLRLIDNKVADKFGVRFQLFKENIKSGSYDETCVPYAIGTNTLYPNASGSEKIFTNFAIIESLKKALNLPNLPILFDEGEALDFSAMPKTESQFICAYVSDKFEKPTARKINKK